MAGAGSAYLASLMLRAVFLPDAFVAPEMLYIALTRSVAPANAVGSQLVEPTVASYDRAPIPLDSDSWGLSGYGEVLNLVPITFPDPVEDWGWCGGWAACDGPNSGMVLGTGTLTNPDAISAGDPAPIIDVGNLRFRWLPPAGS